EQQILECRSLQKPIVSRAKNGLGLLDTVSHPEPRAPVIPVDKKMISIEAHTQIECQVASGVDVILRVERSFVAASMLIEKEGIGKHEPPDFFREIGLFVEQLVEIGNGNGE